MKSTLNRRGHRLGRWLAVSHPTWSLQTATKERDIAAERLELWRKLLLAAMAMLLAWGFLG